MAEEQELTQKEVKRILANLEREIRELAEIGKAIRDSGLTKRAISILLRDLTGIGLRDIEALLNGISRLDEEYLT